MHSGYFGVLIRDRIHKLTVEASDAWAMTAHASVWIVRSTRSIRCSTLPYAHGDACNRPDKLAAGTHSARGPASPLTLSKGTATIEFSG